MNYRYIANRTLRTFATIIVVVTLAVAVLVFIAGELANQVVVALVCMLGVAVDVAAHGVEIVVTTVVQGAVIGTEIDISALAWLRQIEEGIEDIV